MQFPFDAHILPYNSSDDDGDVDEEEEEREEEKQKKMKAKKEEERHITCQGLQVHYLSSSSQPLGLHNVITFYRWEIEAQKGHVHVAVLPHLGDGPLWL